MKFDRENLLSFHSGICLAARNLMEKKNHDYAGSGGEDPFANFRRSEAMGITSTGQAMLVRMTDKFSRLVTFCQGGVLKVEDEKLEDTCQDLINYAVLFAAWAQEVKSEAAEKAQNPAGKDQGPELSPVQPRSETDRREVRNGTGQPSVVDYVSRRSTG